MDNNTLKIGAFVAIAGVLAFAGFEIFSSSGGAPTEGIVPGIVKGLGIPPETVNNLKETAKNLTNAASSAGDAGAATLKTMADAYKNTAQVADRTINLMGKGANALIDAIDPDVQKAKREKEMKIAKEKAVVDMRRARGTRDRAIAMVEQLAKQTDKQITAQEVFQDVHRLFTDKTTTKSPEYNACLGHWYSAEKRGVGYTKFGYDNNDFWNFTQAAMQHFTPTTFYGPNSNYRKLSTNAKTEFKKYYTVLSTASLSPKDQLKVAVATEADAIHKMQMLARAERDRKAALVQKLSKGNAEQQLVAKEIQRAFALAKH